MSKYVSPVRFNFCRISIFAVFILILISQLSNSVELFDEKVDADTLGPSRIHQYIAGKKIETFTQQRAAEFLSEPYRYNQTEFDVNFYGVDLEIDASTEEVYGSVTIEAKSLIPDLLNIEIDLVENLTVDNITSNSSSLSFSRSGDRINIELDQLYQPDEKFSIVIDYFGRPEGAGLSGFNFGTHDGYPVVATLSEPYMSSTWWPCKDRNDDKADSMDISITCATSLFCASNGILVDTTRNGDDTWTFNYEVRYPIATYLFSIAISQYSIWTDWYHYNPTDSMPIVNHVYPEYLDYSKEIDHWGATPYILEVFAELFGEYPFLNEKYGHANFQWGGGMEHQTCTSMGASSFGFSEPVVAHELSHQWWGDMITCNNWHDIWLNEGFASYSEALYYEVKNGVSYYHTYMEDMANGGGTYPGTIYIYDTTNVYNIFNLIVYDKGACVLHMLRHVVGDETFFEIIQTYYNSIYQYADVTTEQFKNLCESVSGMELDYFFDQWIYGTYRPHYQYSYYFEKDNSDGFYWTYLNLKQVQISNPQFFTMPLDVVLKYSPYVLDTFKIFNDSDDITYIFKTEQLPIGTTVDPYNWVLKHIDQETFFQLIPFSLENAEQFTVYEDTVLARGGRGQKHYEIISGNLPDGLILSETSGVISGSPTEFGESSFRVRAWDALSTFEDELDYTLTVLEYEGIPGDADLNREIDILDAVYIIDYKYKNGSAPVMPELADPNNDCLINILDVVYVINFKYKDGPEPIFGCATI